MTYCPKCKKEIDMMSLSCPHCKQILDLPDASENQQPLKYRKTRELIMAVIIFLGSLYNMTLYSTGLSQSLTVGDIILMILYIPFTCIVAILDALLRFIAEDYWKHIIDTRLGVILGLLLCFMLSYLISKIFYNYSNEDNYLTRRRSKSH